MLEIKARQLINLQKMNNEQKDQNLHVSQHSSNEMLAAGWIAIEESLPEYNTPVLVCQKNNDDSIQICRLESVTERKDKEQVKKSYEWYEGRHGYDTWYCDVTHWMPLTACR